nr:hypothetical protein [Mesoplasma tabanidae]
MNNYKQLNKKDRYLIEYLLNGWKVLLILQKNWIKIDQQFIEK